VVGPYDIAVVLTGLNDLKDAFLPFMMSAQRARMLQEAAKEQLEQNVNNTGIKGALIRILHALEEKMNIKLPLPKQLQSGDDDGDHHNDGHDDGHQSTAENTSTAQPSQSSQQNEMSPMLQNRRRLPRPLNSSRPLVVFPALPIEPIELSHRAPLSWFILPIIRAMDNNKYMISKMFPNLVVFIDSPSYQVLSQIEAGRGPLWERQNHSVVLFHLTDALDDSSKDTKQSMRRHYESWFVDAGEYDTQVNAGLYELQLDDVVMVDQRLLVDTQEQTGSTMVSCDGVHPSDHGYVYHHMDLKRIVLRI